MPDRQEGAKNPVVAYLNGSPTDNNATLFKNGYDSVLKPKFDSEEYTKGPDQSVPDWDNTQAGTIFEQMLTTDRAARSTACWPPTTASATPPSRC